MNLLFSADHSYKKHLIECIHSIQRFETKDGYDIYILYSDFTEEDIEEIKERFGTTIRFHFIYVDKQMVTNFPKTKRYPEEIYYRIYAKQFLPEDIDRILYLDADTIIINPLDELYNKEFHDNYYLACTHVRKVLNKINLIRLGIDEKCQYINSGVMLINLKKLRQEQNLEEVREYVDKHKDFLMLPDQDIITALYGNKVGILDSRLYNLSDRIIYIQNTTIGKSKIDIAWVQKNTVIIHYYGKQKPWNDNYKGILSKFYQDNLKEMEENV